MSPGPQQVVVIPDKIRAVLAAILTADGCADDEAETVATHLVDASLKGHDSHGVIRILRYHAWLESGQLVPRQDLKVISDSDSLVHFDGGSGMGQHLTRRATQVGIQRAKRHGTAIVALRRAGHIGRLGDYAEQAAEAGIVSLQFCNVAGSRLVAPFGAAQRCISTAPIAIGVPLEAGDAFILDFATSLVAEGKALVAGQGGNALPGDALVDGEGQLSADPRALYGASLDTTVPDPRDGDGALRTMGDHKGSGLALACELLAGALTGNGTNGAQDHPFGNGWFAVFIDPASMDDLQGFAAEAAGYIRYVRDARPAVGTTQVLAPGDTEKATRLFRLEHGLPLSASVFDAIGDVASSLSIIFDRTEILHPANLPS
ncbi:MAG: Ldh family oxidoreductase [Pseudomonadota bacterium]